VEDADHVAEATAHELNHGSNVALPLRQPTKERRMTGGPIELAFVIALASGLFFSAWHFVAPLFG